MSAPASKPTPIPFRKPGRRYSAVRLAKVFRAEALELKGEVCVSRESRSRASSKAA